MVAPSGNEEQVRYDILIEAKAAIQSMRDMLKYTSDNTVKMTEFTNQVLSDSKRWGVSWQQALATYKQLNAELAKQKKGTLFGQTGGQDLFGQTEKYMESLQGAGRLTEELGTKTEAASHRAVRGIDAMRIALGALVAMIVFNVIQAFQNMISGAINGLRELESATFNLINAEQKLSSQGIAITPKDLDEIINKLRTLDPLLSKVQATELVSSVAAKVAPSVGLGKDEIASLTQSIAILAVRNKALGKSFEEVESQIENAFLSGKVSVGINQLGVKISDQIVQEKALAMGLVSTADAYDKLDAKQKAHINALTMIQILEENTNQERGHLPDFLKTADAAFGIFQARASDVLTEIGTQLAPVLIKVFSAAADGLERMYEWMTKNRDAIAVWVKIAMVAGEVVLKLVDLLMKFGTVMGLAARSIGEAGNRLQAFIDKHPGLKKLVDTLKSAFPNLAAAPDTPTTGASEFGANTEQATQENIAKAVEEGQKKLQEILKDSADKKLDIERDYQRKLQDIATNYQQKLEDIARNTAQKREDALRNYNQKVEDINRDANQKIQDAQQEARQKEIDREAEFQNKLRELREKFLFDLEDALRERDARQVLRLIRQYNMDKNNLEERHKLDRVQAKKDLQAKLQDIEYERQKKLEAARREYEQKLQEIKIGEARERAEARLWKQRQLEDARIWHQRQLEEQRQYLQRKLRDLADALKAEYNLTNQGMQAINNLLAAGYNVPSAIVNAIGGNPTPINSNGAITGWTGGGWDAQLNSWANSGLYGTGGMAEGGNLIATRPTKVTVGERGAEKLSVTPLNKIGNNVGKTFGDRSAMGTEGNVKIALELSPDLEARIVESSLDGVAVTLERITREK